MTRNVRRSLLLATLLLAPFPLLGLAAAEGTTSVPAPVAVPDEVRKCWAVSTPVPGALDARACSGEPGEGPDAGDLAVACSTRSFSVGSATYGVIACCAVWGSGGSYSSYCDYWYF